MTYSCVDFTDDILNTLGTKVPASAWDNPQAQAALAVAQIQRLQEVETAARGLLERWGKGNLSEVIQALDAAIKLVDSPLVEDDTQCCDGQHEMCETCGDELECSQIGECDVCQAGSDENS